MNYTKRKNDLKSSIGESLTLLCTSNNIEHAYEELNGFSWSEIDYNTYEQEEKRERDAKSILAAAFYDGKIEGKAEGKAEGKTEKAIAICKQMLLAKIDDVTILQCTRLSKEALARLKNEIAQIH